MYTKGEWKISICNRPKGNPAYSRTKDREVFYRIENTETTELHPTKEHRANAQLIASAPDLLEACKEAKQMILMGYTQEDDPERFNRMEQVINKAEGK